MSKGRTLTLFILDGVVRDDLFAPALKTTGCGEVHFYMGDQRVVFAGVTRTQRGRQLCAWETVSPLRQITQRYR